MSKWKESIEQQGSAEYSNFDGYHFWIEEDQPGEETYRIDGFKNEIGNHVRATGLSENALGRVLEELNMKLDDYKR